MTMKKVASKEDISNLISASTYSMALGAAIETRLIQMLADKPMSGDEISRAMNIPRKRGYYWLQMLAEFGILELESNKYAPTSLTCSVLLDPGRMERWKHIVIDEREHLAGVCNMAAHISDVSIWKAQGMAEPKGYVEKMSDEPDRARVFTRLLYNFYQDSRNTFAEFLDMTGVERMMDVGGGPGGVSMALVRRYPTLKSVVVDVENVCITGREIVEENQLSDRITFHAANFATDELPKGFDVILHCDIGVFGEDLFRKLRSSLKPGGWIAVIFQFSHSENTAPAPYLKWAFLDSLKDPAFGFPTVHQIQAQLVAAGFRLLPGEHTFPEGHILIQAQNSME
jgi:ubiquinone/menaquinone biosynthesis C-methylase UbiE